MGRLKLDPTEIQIQGNSGIAEKCLGKAMVKLELGSRIHDEEIYFSNKQYQITCQGMPA